MKQIRIPAAFIRGATSIAIVFSQKDLPRERAVLARASRFAGLVAEGGGQRRAA